MSERFFCDVPITGGQVTLEGPEAHHLVHVMRAKVGDRVVLFDGSDAEFSALVTEIGRAAVVLQICDRQSASREPPRQLILGVAMPKGERQRWLVEKAVELGVAEVVPLITARAVAQSREGTRRRLERTIIEASKQCGRNSLMRLGNAIRIEDYLASERPEADRWIAHPCHDLPATVSPTALTHGQTPEVIHVAVGPEGGFTNQEIALAADHGWRVVDLGPRVLRVETAAIAMASWMLLG